MPAKDTEDKDNSKDIEMPNKTTIQGHHSPGLQTCTLQLSPGLFYQCTANPTDSTPPGAFAASVNGFMFVQVFKSEACVSSWDSLFLILITYDYQSIPPPDLPESLVLHPH